MLTHTCMGTLHLPCLSVQVDVLGIGLVTPFLDDLGVQADTVKEVCEQTGMC